jgi:signal transduction histidine kinase
VPPVVGDGHRLQQVFWNLLSNAVKFTGEGGTITVTLRVAPAHVEFEIADTGVGIRRDVLPFVFDRFRQADSSMKRTHGGLGLGLAIVRHIVELHGGSVHAVSAGKATARRSSSSCRARTWRGGGAGRVCIRASLRETTPHRCFAAARFSWSKITTMPAS